MPGGGGGEALTFTRPHKGSPQLAPVCMQPLAIETMNPFLSPVSVHSIPKLVSLLLLLLLLFDRRHTCKLERPLQLNPGIPTASVELSLPQVTLSVSAFRHFHKVLLSVPRFHGISPFFKKNQQPQPQTASARLAQTSPPFQVKPADDSRRPGSPNKDYEDGVKCLHPPTPPPPTPVLIWRTNDHRASKRKNTLDDRNVPITMRQGPGVEGSPKTRSNKADFLLESGAADQEQKTEVLY